MTRRWLTTCIALLFAVLSGPAAAQTVLEDPLDGSTIGTRDGGQFVAGGWQAPGQVTWDLGVPDRTTITPDEGNSTLCPRFLWWRSRIRNR
jgi:hypothetical protein